MYLRTPQDIAEIIREQRKQQGWSQEELASRAGVGRVWVAEFENGKPKAQLAHVLRALNALQIPISAVVEEKNQTEKPLIDLNQLLDGDED